MYGHIAVFEFRGWFVLQKLEQPSFGLLRVPGESVSIDFKSSICCRIDKIRYVAEVHVSVAIDAA